MDKKGTLSIKRVKVIAGLDVVLLLLASPLFLFPRPAYAPVLLLIPILWAIRWRFQGTWAPLTPLNLPLLGLLLMVLVSMWATPDFSHSFRKVVGLLYGVGLFYALIAWAKTLDTLVPVSLLVVMLGVVGAALGFLGTRWTIKFGVLQGLIAALPQEFQGVLDSGVGFNPNTVAGTLIMVVPLQCTISVALAREKRFFWAVLSGIALLLTGGVVFLAQSRAAWGALFLGMTIMLGVMSKPFRWGILLTAGVGLIALLIVGPATVGDLLLEQAMVFDPKTISMSGRVEIWSRALYGIADFSFTGMGMDMFRRVVWILYPLFTISPETDIGHAHNIFLQTATDLGIPGLLCYMAMLMNVFVIGWKSCGKPTSTYQRLIVLGGLAGLFSHAVWGMVDSLPLGSRTHFLWWALIALVVVAGMWPEHENLISEETAVPAYTQPT